MLAGPNGSGKSSLVPRLRSVVDLGVSVNADEIQLLLRTQASLPFADWQLYLTQTDLESFSSLPGSQRLPSVALNSLHIVDNKLLLSAVKADAYLSAWVAELLRFHLLQEKRSLLFETVMSHQSKVDFLAEARIQGFRTYLYYVATVDPLINLERVAARVAKGGHPVSPAKIVERYQRSLDLLLPAIK
ncbi:MAG: hypothetical protein EOO60_03495 [Hymenobacter sp.]|nr:MAG: hypothetical protein EOO60_03495 [Hymenobacter sp.]